MVLLLIAFISLQNFIQATTNLNPHNNHKNRKQKNKRPNKPTPPPAIAPPAESPYLIKEVNHDVVLEFIPFASYSYCDEKRMKAGTCCSQHINEKDGWVLDFSMTINYVHNYTLGILRNDEKKRIVATFTGTKTLSQLTKEAWESGMVKFGRAAYGMFILSYFQKVWRSAKSGVKEKLESYKTDYPDYQLFFTGHSLGAAIATLFAVDAVSKGYVKRTNYSPVLINYASPRVGNFLFAVNTMRIVPQVYRVVRNFDPVTSLPPCSYLLGRFCSSTLGNSLQMSEEKIREAVSQNKVDKKYWHIGGLVLYDRDNKEYEYCGKYISENHEKTKKCSISYGYASDTHTQYLGTNIGRICSEEKRFLRKLNKKLRRKMRRMSRRK